MYMNINIDRKAIDKAVRDMSLFSETKNVLAAYKAEANKLNEQQLQLRQKLDDLQSEHIANLLDKQNTEDINELVYLTRQSKEIIRETEVIDTLLEQNFEDRTELKLKYVPKFQEALRSDQLRNAGKYNANLIVEQLRYEMLSAISDLGQEMDKQYNEVAPDIYSILEDEAVLEAFPRLKYAFHQDQYRPLYEEPFPTVVSKQDVFNATVGIVNYPDPNEVKTNE
jgi:hypothetical protein